MKSKEEMLTEEMSDAKSYVHDYLIRSIRVDPQEFSKDMANSFLNRFSSIYENYKNELGPIQAEFKITYNIFRLSTKKYNLWCRFLNKIPIFEQNTTF